MKKKLIVFMFSFIVTVPVWAAKPRLEQISAETLENGSPYGDSIRVIFDQSMKNAVPDFRINSNVSIPQAPAGYRNDAYQSARLAAKNYLVQIIPETGSRTRANTKSWADLGGEAIYDPYDPQGKTVLLVLSNKENNLFHPGDTIKVTIQSTIVNPAGENLNTTKNIKLQVSS